MTRAERKAALVEQAASILRENAPADELEGTFWNQLCGIPGRKVSEPEALSRLWGYAYGVSVGLAQVMFPDLSRKDLAELTFDVATEAFRGTSLVDLELIRLLENNRIDQAQMSPETIEAIDEALTRMEAEAAA